MSSLKLLTYFSANNPHFYDPDMDSNFMVQIIREYSKFEDSFCHNNMIKFYPE